VGLLSHFDRRILNFIRSCPFSEKNQQYLEYITIIKIVNKKEPCCVNPAGGAEPQRKD
jgi:hypothetical protein